jgi:hypothetical protein
MPQRRHTITVASSALFFVCLVFNAQTRLYSQTSNTRVVAHLKSGIQSSALFKLFKSHSTGWKTLADRASHSAGSQITFYPVAAIFYTLESKDDIWTNLRWQGTSRAWAS